MFAGRTCKQKEEYFQPVSLLPISSIQRGSPVQPASDLLETSQMHCRHVKGQRLELKKTIKNLSSGGLINQFLNLNNCSGKNVMCFI